MVEIEHLEENVIRLKANAQRIREKLSEKHQQQLAQIWLNASHVLLGMVVLIEPEELWAQCLTAAAVLGATKFIYDHVTVDRDEINFYAEDKLMNIIMDDADRLMTVNANIETDLQQATRDEEARKKQHDFYRPVQYTANTLLASWIAGPIGATAATLSCAALEWYGHRPFTR